MKASVTSGSAALTAEVCKRNSNDAKCSELGWSYIPIAVETFGYWGADFITPCLSGKGLPKILTSDGLAPNNETTWNLLLSKHPASQLSTIPEITQEPVSLRSDFNILSVLRSFPKDAGAGPSGLHVQHLLDVSSTALPTPICASLREVMNLLASGKAPPTVSKYLAGGNLIALNKLKEGCPPDIRPIAVGETLRRLASKCICALIKERISNFFQPLQLGVATSAGAEKNIASEVAWMKIGMMPILLFLK